MSLSQLPDEVIQHLAYYVPPVESLLVLGLLSRRFHRLADEPLLWRHHCRSSFRFWQPQHGIDAKLRRGANEVDWKQLFIFRHRRNTQILRLFEEMLLSSIGRVKKFELICRTGYDAKDALLDQYHCCDAADDVLARRYFSGALLDSLHRSVAIQEWHLLRVANQQAGGDVARGALERALGAFDMFVLRDQEGTIEDISALLDAKAAEFRLAEPRFAGLTTRQKALSLVRWLRENHLVGLRDAERRFRNLRNCLLGQALRQPDHESIPIVSSALFCCLAERLGLAAQCSAFPGHVHTIVYAPHGATLDGQPVQDCAAGPAKMYLDPFGRDDEVRLSDLQQHLSQLGWPVSAERAMEPASPVVIALRTSHNIKATASRMRELLNSADDHAALADLRRLSHGNDMTNMEAASYAAHWAKLLLTRVDTFEWERDLAHFVRRFHDFLHEDAWLVEEYLQKPHESFMPLRATLARNFEPHVTIPWEMLQKVRHADELPPPQLRRTPGTDDDVPYRVGQVFRHRRHGWTGIIVSWLPYLHVPSPTPADRSPTRGTPSEVEAFFICLQENVLETPLVAVDSIVIIRDSAVINLDKFPLAGKFFKRFDRESCAFVSNIKEQYPDD